MNDFRFPTQKKRLTQWERVKILALIVAGAVVLGWIGSGSFAAFDGSGTYNRTQDYTADRDAGPPTNVISADKFDDDLDGMATALSLTIVKDGQQTTTAVIPFAFGISSDTIVEDSAAAGVTIDSVLLKDGGITLGGALDEILGGDTDGTMILSADTASGQGGNITLFGNTHATLASDVLFRDDTTSTLQYDKSATLWDFQANDLITTGAVSVDTINEASSAAGVTIDSVLIKDNVVTATTLAGTLSTAAQTNITSVGTLGSLAVTNAVVAATGTFTNVAGTLSTAAQATITSVGSLTSLDVAGTLTVDTIDETTATVGVTIDGVLMKDDGSLAVQTAGEVAGYKVTRDYATNTAMVQAVQSGTPGGSAGNVAGYLANIVQSSQLVWSGQLDSVETSSIDGEGDMVLAGNLSIDDTTASTSGTTGSLHTDGGLGVAKEAYITDAVIVGSPTGGDKGAGTINAQGIFVNGSAVGVGSGDMIGTNNLSDVSSASTSRANLGINNWTKHSTVHTAVSSGATLTWTSIPSGVTSIRIAYEDNSASSVGNFAVQLGDSGGFEVTGYSGRTRNSSSGSNWSASGLLVHSGAAADVLNGMVTITNITSNLWLINGTATIEAGELALGAGSKSLSGTLTQVQVLSGGTAFDGSGNYALYYQ